jgi:hypothetical protein
MASQGYSPRHMSPILLMEIDHDHSVPLNLLIVVSRDSQRCQATQSATIMMN